MNPTEIQIWRASLQIGDTVGCITGGYLRRAKILDKRMAKPKKVG